MPLKKVCRCGRIIDYNQRFCPACAKKYERRQQENNQQYDRTTRDKKAAGFYHSTAWIKTRQYILRKYKGLDLYALFILNHIEYADTVHHIIELREDWGRRLDTDNLFPLSSSNHNAIHSMYDKDKKGTQKLLHELLDRWKAHYA